MRKSAVSMVKNIENEKSAAKTANKNTVKLTFSMFDVHFHCFSCLKREKMNPSPDPGDSADPADPADPVHGLPLGTSPTRAGGQDDVS